MGKQILNSQQTRVRLFETSISIDKSLPKYAEMDNRNEENKKIDLFTTPDSLNELDDIDYASLKKWYSNKDNIKEFNIGISEKMRRNLDSLSVREPILSSGFSNPIKNNLYNAIKQYFKSKKSSKEENDKKKKFDVIKFFEKVKLATENEELKYANRIVSYITCIGYAEKAGQTALKEKLFENLVINKYESILYAKGFTKALNEKTLVQLAKNCPKELSLDYVANYVRTIPIDAINKMIKANEMEVFDNYVILYYDPDNTSSEMTNKEKKAEMEKAKDPILFGVISGSNKLYYVCDWIDEMYDDDITWDKVVEILGREIVEKNAIPDIIK